MDAGQQGPMPALGEHPRVSVIMPARTAQATIRAAIASIARQPVDEIIVAVPPGDPTREVLADLGAHDPRLTVVDNPSGLIPHGLNLAVAASSGDVLVRVDAHSDVPEGYVERAVTVLRERNAANVGGRQIPVWHGGGFGAAVAAAMATRLGSGGATYRVGREAGVADTVFLGVFRRDALAEAGGFDEGLLRNEDAELNLRLTAAGHLVWFDPELAVRYQPRNGVAALARQYFANGRWRRLTTRRHRGSLSPRQLLPALALISVLGSVLLAVSMRTWWWLVPIGVYLVALLFEALRALLALRREQSPSATVLRHAPLVAVAYLTMHLAFGAGFLIGPPRPSFADESA